jgi:DNA topoisomerase IB
VKTSTVKKPDLTIITDPVESAKTAGLRYVTDASPGILRKQRGKGFSYIGVDGKPLSDASERDRIEALGIPPAWKDVWICPLPTDTCKQRDTMRKDASSTAIITTGEPSALKLSSTA